MRLNRKCVRAVSAKDFMLQKYNIINKLGQWKADIFLWKQKFNI